MSQTALDELAALVRERYGAGYVKTTQYKTKAKSAQEAHEAVRPTAVTRSSSAVAIWLATVRFHTRS